MTVRYPYVHVAVGAEDAEAVSYELWELGANGIEERDGSTMNAPDRGAALTLVASFADEAGARTALASLAGRFAARLEFVEGDAWREAYKAYFKPTRVGERIVVKPSWESYAPAPGDVVLTLDPGGAFGTGTHETTRLVLEALQDHLKHGSEVLDVGTGSGILAIACLLLGAARARAIDVDPEAIAVARENAVANAVAERFFASAEPLAAIDARYPLVLANIESRVLVPLARELAARVKPGGVLILSGILAHERETLLAAYRGFRRVAIREQGEWIALVLESERDAG